MSETIYEVDYAGYPVYYSFSNSSCRYYFRDYIRHTDADHYDIKVAQEQIEGGRPFLPPDSSDSYIEYRLLIQLTSKFLLRYDCCIFHCVSFIYKGYAWLLTAPSKTGKTTQFMNWQELYPQEITMISGDMPVLELYDNHHIRVCPSPWNGKENIGNKKSAPLGGVIYLSQDTENQICEYPVETDLIDIIRQFIVLPDTKDEIMQLMKIVNTMMSDYPVRLFINKGDQHSTEMLKNEIDHLIVSKKETI